MATKVKFRQSIGEERLLCEDYLDRDKSLQEDVSGYLRECESADRSRRESLYRRWEEEHFEPHQRDVGRQFAGPKYANLRRQKYSQTTRYLDTTDRKGHVFLESYSPKDGYDPFLVSGHQPPALKPLPSAGEWSGDPLLYHTKESHHTASIRMGTVGVSPSGRMRGFPTSPAPAVQHPLKPLGRHGTTLETWKLMHQSYVDSASRQLCQRKVSTGRNKSNGCAESLVDPLAVLPAATSLVGPAAVPLGTE